MIYHGFTMIYSEDGIFSHEKMMKNMGFNDEKPSMMTQLGLNQPLLVGKTHYLEASSY